MNILPGYSLPSNFMLGVEVFVLKSQEGGGEERRYQQTGITFDPWYVILSTPTSPALINLYQHTMPQYSSSILYLCSKSGYKDLVFGVGGGGIGALGGGLGGSIYDMIYNAKVYYSMHYPPYAYQQQTLHYTTLSMGWSKSHWHTD